MHGDCSLRIHGPDFTYDQIAECATRQGLLSIELEMAPTDDELCHCDACASHPGPGFGLLSIALQCDLLTQAKAMGCSRLSLFNQPAQPNHRATALLDHGRALDMDIEWHITGQGMTDALARALHQGNVTVSLPLDSLDPSLQNHLAGRSDAYAEAHHALKLLLLAGYGGQTGPLLAARIGVSADNIQEIPQLWRWLRSQNLAPWLQTVTRRSLARLGSRDISLQELASLWDALEQIDSREFGKHWPRTSSSPVRACSRPIHGCHVAPCGHVFACVGLGIPLGRIGDRPLADIIGDSEIIDNLHRHQATLKPPCSKCSTNGAPCCRGNAWQSTGDYLAPDPLCPQTKHLHIESLPSNASLIIPHGPSMCVIDTVDEILEHQFHTRWRIREESVFVNADGTLDPTMYIEIIAQSCAASHGYQSADRTRKRDFGLLLGIRDLVVHAKARPGDDLRITIHKDSRFGNFMIVYGTITKSDGTLIATGELKIWRPDEDQTQLLG